MAKTETKTAAPKAPKASTRAAPPPAAAPEVAETEAAVEEAFEVDIEQDAATEETMVEGAEAAATTEGALSVYEQLLAAIGEHDASFAPQHDKESNNDFATRIIRATAELPEDIWNALPESPTQEWYNAAVEALEGGKPVPPCPGHAEAVAVSGLAATAAVSAKKGPSKAAPKAPKAPPAPKVPAGPKTDGVVYRLRSIILANHAKPVDQVRKLAEAAHPDIKASSFSTIYSDTMGTLKHMKELGMWAG